MRKTIFKDASNKKEVILIKEFKSRVEGLAMFIIHEDFYNPTCPCPLKIVK